jgi:hypothetical protein
MRKACAVALPVVCVVLASCSMLRRPELFDVTGCEEIKWGMTLTQAKPLLGSGAQISTDQESGKSFETVKIMIGDVELSGFVGTKSGSDQINGVYLAYLDEPSLRKVSQEKFQRLRYIFNETVWLSTRLTGWTDLFLGTCIGEDCPRHRAIRRKGICPFVLHSK